MPVNTKQMSNDAFVEFCFNWILRRKPNTERRQYYATRLNALEMSREELLVELITSEDNRQILAASEFVPHGHFYSAVPSGEERREFLNGNPSHFPLVAINKNEEKQLALLEEFTQYYAECPFPEQKSPGHRYYFQNPSYSYFDAIILYCMMRHFKPKKIVEVGSGFSSCVMLDTNDRFFDGRTKITFIEPFPQLLRSLVANDDANRHLILEQKIQETPLEVFESLDKNDILFIDSTHVSKLQSDVNRIIFEILPSLKKGVLIHIHDIFWPFEYPKAWISIGRSWNEAYILRAFLEYNEAFEIAFFASFIEEFHSDWLKKNMPLCLRNTGGNIWLRKLL